MADVGPITFGETTAVAMTAATPNTFVGSTVKPEEYRLYSNRSFHVDNAAMAADDIGMPVCAMEPIYIRVAAGQTLHLRLAAGETAGNIWITKVD